MPCATQHFNIVIFVASTSISINTVFVLFVKENRINGDCLHEGDREIQLWFSPNYNIIPLTNARLVYAEDKSQPLSLGLLKSIFVAARQGTFLSLSSMSGRMIKRLTADNRKEPR